MLRKGEVVFAGPIQDLFDQQQPFMIVKTQNEQDLAKIIALAESAKSITQINKIRRASTSGLTCRFL